MSCFHPFQFAIPQNSTEFYTCVTNTIDDTSCPVTSPDLITGIAITGITMVTVSLCTALIEAGSKRFTILINLRRNSNHCGKLSKGLYFIATRILAISIPAFAIAQACLVTPPHCSSFSDFYFNIFDRCISGNSINNCFYKGGPSCFPPNGPLCYPASCFTLWMTSASETKNPSSEFSYTSLPAFLYTGTYLSLISWKPLLNRFTEIKPEHEEEEEEGQNIDEIKSELLPLRIQNLEIERNGLSSIKHVEHIKDNFCIGEGKECCHFWTNCFALIALPFLAIGTAVILSQGFDFKPWRNPYIEAISILEQCANNCTIFNSLVCTCQQVSDSIFCGQNNTFS